LVTLFGAKPRPRVLCWGIDPHGELADNIAELAPYMLFFTESQGLLRHHQKESDAAIVWGNPPALADHLKVIQFGGDQCGSFSPEAPWQYEIRILQNSSASEFGIPDAVSPAIKRLVLSSLKPLVESRTPNGTIVEVVRTSPGVNVSPPPSMIDPFLVDVDEKPLAGRILCGTREWWWLPENPDPSAWITVALTQWSETDPKSFPQKPVWVSRPVWQTPEELEHAARFEHFREEQSRLLSELGQREASYLQTSEELRKRADHAERRLLTCQGDDLRDEVKLALEEIGFDVTNVDQDIARKGDLLEDLRVTDPRAPGWISLVEVRGYAGGAKLGDLQRIGRFVERYIRKEGDAPSARWYIVNHHIDQDPSTRPMPLVSNPEEVEIFAETGGLVIDTRMLFTIGNNVRSGSLEAEAARLSMRQSSGTFQVD